MVPADSRIEAFVKKQIADANGRFVFKNVPPGEYFITTKVIWEAPTGYKGSLQPQGGTITKRVPVKNDEEIDVILTR
jgi:hypothetical protein